MSEGRTVRVDRQSGRIEQPAHPPGLLQFHPLSASGGMRFFVLAAGQTTIGRAAECTVAVDDEEISRQHARVEGEGPWQITDCDSANGLFVGARRVSSATLEGGEVIRLGATLFRFLRAGLADASGEHAVCTTGIVSGPALDDVRALLDRAAPQDLTVLITGETGTGKELAAQRLHEGGSRRGGPFVAVNCSAIPAEIVESELFGHVKGAFTGASGDKLGLIRQAAGGTLLLDEIGELPLTSQAKLLRVLQDRQVRPVGGGQPIAVDTRVVCATNRDLEAQVRQLQFRPDLYARIAELVVRLPPLRDRIEDVPLLVAHFVAKHGRGREAVLAEALDLLCARRWPFNVRQLESAVRRALLLASDARRLGPEHFEDDGVAAEPAATEAQDLEATRQRIRELEARALAPAKSDNPQARRIEEALRQHQGDARRAAEEIGISRSQLYRRAKKFGINVGHFKP